MRFTISDETGQVTLLDMFTLWCFMVPPGCGYIAGKEAGSIVGIMIGIGVGLVAGGLANYALNRTVEYLFKLLERFKSQPWVVKLIDLGYVWTLFLTLAAAGWGTFFLTGFIVQRMAG
jgi:hypothetical protein